MTQFQNVYSKSSILILDYVGLSAKLESHIHVDDDHMKTKHLET